MTVATAPSERTDTFSPSLEAIYALEPRLDPRLLEVVQEILGLVLEPQDRHLRPGLEQSASGTPSIRSPTRIGWP